jgi:hypothetical protein
MKQILAIAALAGITASCNTNYEKTDSGLTYKIFKGDGFIDTIEREELAGFIKYAAETYGLKYEGDVTEEYRKEW